MTSDRLRKVNRILKVQQQLHEVAEWKLARLQRRSAELKAAQEDIIQTLNDDASLHGLFLDAKAKRLQALAGQAVQVDAARTAQQEVTLQRAMQVKRTERMVVNLKVETRRDEEKRDLLSILDTIAKAHASPK